MKFAIEALLDEEHGEDDDSYSPEQAIRGTLEADSFEDVCRQLREWWPERLISASIYTVH